MSEELIGSSQQVFRTSTGDIPQEGFIRFQWGLFVQPGVEVPALIQNQEIKISYHQLANYLTVAEEDERMDKNSRTSRNIGWQSTYSSIENASQSSSLSGTHESDAITED